MFKLKYLIIYGRISTTGRPLVIINAQKNKIPPHVIFFKSKTCKPLLISANHREIADINYQLNLIRDRLKTTRKR